MEVEPVLDLNEFEKDNVEVLEFDDGDCDDETLFGNDLTVTDVPEGIPLTLSRFLVLFPDSLTFVGFDLVTTSEDLLSTFLTLVFSSSKSFFVMVVWPPSKEAGGFAGTAMEESFFAWLMLGTII